VALSIGEFSIGRKM